MRVVVGVGQRGGGVRGGGIGGGGRGCGRGVGGVSDGRSPPSLPSVLLFRCLPLDSFICVRILPSSLPPSLFGFCLSVSVSLSLSLSLSQLITITPSSPVPPPVALFTVDEECFPYRIKRVL